VDCIFTFAATRRYEQSEAVLKSVDSSLIIGGTWYNYPPGIRAEGELDKINAGAEAAERGWDTAYAKLEPLPLYEAYEGKNRVRAFQSAGRDISAFTSARHFPPAGQLMLHDVARSSFPAVSDMTTRKDYVLVLPSVTVPLLESYGVPWGARVSGGLHTRRAWKRERRQIQIKLINSHMLW
jgi:hypothetical protein